MVAAVTPIANDIDTSTGWSTLTRDEANEVRIYATDTATAATNKANVAFADGKNVVWEAGGEWRGLGELVVPRASDFGPTDCRYTTWWGNPLKGRPKLYFKAGANLADPDHAANGLRLDYARASGTHPGFSVIGLAFYGYVDDPTTEFWYRNDRRAISYFHPSSPSDYVSRKLTQNKLLIEDCYFECWDTFAYVVDNYSRDHERATSATDAGFVHLIYRRNIGYQTLSNKSHSVGNYFEGLAEGSICEQNAMSYCGYTREFGPNGNGRNAPALTHDNSGEARKEEHGFYYQKFNGKNIFRYNICLNCANYMARTVTGDILYNLGLHCGNSFNPQSATPFPARIIGNVVGRTANVNDVQDPPEATGTGFEGYIRSDMTHCIAFARGGTLTNGGNNPEKAIAFLSRDGDNEYNTAVGWFKQGADYGTSHTYTRNGVRQLFDVRPGTPNAAQDNNYCIEDEPETYDAFPEITDDDFDNNFRTRELGEWNPDVHSVKPYINEARTATNALILADYGVADVYSDMPDIPGNVVSGDTDGGGGPGGGGEPETPPYVSAGADRVLQLPTSSTTLLALAVPAEGRTLAAYAWTQVSGPNTATLTNDTTKTLTASDLIEGDYVFRVTATDNEDDEASDDVTLSVVAVGTTPPVVDAGVDVTIKLPTSSVELRGTASDPDGSIASTQWTNTAKPAGADDPAIADDTSLVTTASGMTTPGDYTFQLEATDDDALSATDTMTVTVEDFPDPGGGSPGDAPAIVQSASDTDVTNTLTLVLPSAPTLGNRLLFVAGIRSNFTFSAAPSTADATWTRIVDLSGGGDLGDMDMIVELAVVDGDIVSGNSFTVTASNSAVMYAAVIEIEDATGYESLGTNSITNNTAAANLPDVSTLGPNRLVVSGGVTRSDLVGAMNSLGGPAGWTETVEELGNNRTCLGLYTLQQATQDDLTGLSMTLDKPARSKAFSIAFTPSTTGIDAGGGSPWWLRAVTGGDE